MHILNQRISISSSTADKSLARQGRKQATATEDFIFKYPISNHNWGNISIVYTYNKTSIKRNILTIKQNTLGSRSGQGLISTPVYASDQYCISSSHLVQLLCALMIDQ
jgi:hypothetical protein